MKRFSSGSPGVALVLVLLAAVIGTALGAAPMADVLGWSTLLFAAVVVFVVGARNPPLWLPLVLGFLLRATLAVVDIYVMPLPGSGKDTVMFEKAAWDLAQYPLSVVLSSTGSGAQLYISMIGIMYAVTDRSPLMIEAVNVLLGSLVIWQTYAISHELWGKEAAVRSAWIVAFFPTLVMNSALILREAVAISAATLGVLYFVRWYRIYALRWLAGSMLLLLLASGFHSGFVVALAGAVFLVVRRWALLLTSGRTKSFLLTTVALAIAVGIAGVMLGSGWGLDKLDRFQDLSATETLTAVHELQERGDATYLVGWAIKTPLDLIWQTPIRLVLYLFAPFIWMARGFADLMGVFDAVLYLILSWSIYRARGRIRASQGARAVFVLNAAVVLTFALSVSNYGTAIRHRAKTAPLMIVLACAGAETARLARRRSRLAQPREDLHAVESLATRQTQSLSSHAVWNA